MNITTMYDLTTEYVQGLTGLSDWTRRNILKPEQCWHGDYALHLIHRRYLYNLQFRIDEFDRMVPIACQRTSFHDEPTLVYKV